MVMYVCRHVCMNKWMPIIGRWKVSTCDCTRMYVGICMYVLCMDMLTSDTCFSIGVFTHLNRIGYDSMEA